MGMLGPAVYVLSMNNGPIADNAGGIAEMSHQPSHVRDSTDALDAAGNVTKAITKGYSIGSAALACFLLFGAFLDEFSQFSGLPFEVVDVAKPEVLMGGLLGVMTVFQFAGMAIAAVLAGYLVFGTVSGILMALFLDNVGGAWDNAKKYVELGNYGGKNPDAHKASITGDTVGDPLKDTAGPSLHVVIKLLSTTILVLGPLFIAAPN
ncbi:hydrogen-translocating pyrophosphatase [Aureococcus anophagefferens]|nr:hydrogen-translocating pyrophosphatase [Aureococcus anophagefferens]